MKHFPTLAFAGLLALPASLAAQSSVIEAARRVVATSQLAAVEYKLAFQAGVLVNEAEWEEARLFIAEARRSARDLPPELAANLDSVLAHLGTRVEARFSPDSLTLAAAAVQQQLSRALGVSFDERPSRNPSLVQGSLIYDRQCAACHGASGMGDGAAGAALNPPPTNLTDPALLATATPLDFYRKVTHGVPSTGMAAFEQTLTREERWDAIAWVFALTDSVASRGQSGHVAVAFGEIRGTLGTAMEFARGGDAELAATRVLDAYMAFEAVEASLGATDPAIVNRAERDFMALRAAAGAGNAAATERAYGNVQVVLLDAQRALVEGRSGMVLFAGSLLLMLREGFEAILVVGAIMAVLARSGARRRMRNVRWGIGTAIAASLVTAAVIQWIFLINPAQQEALEGAVMLIAAATLFYVSYWLISKVEIAAWTRFVKDQIERAVESGSGLALAGVAFLAVYREGFETVLFYKALYITGGSGGVAPITAGMVLGAVALVGLYVAIEKFGLRVPMRPFFAATSATLALMAFVFAGKGIAELQAGGYLGLTAVEWAPRIPVLGIYPSVQSLAAQGIILLAVLGAGVWTFLIQSRRIAAQAAREAALAAGHATREPAAV